MSEDNEFPGLLQRIMIYINVKRNVEFIPGVISQEIYLT